MDESHVFKFSFSCGSNKASQTLNAPIDIENIRRKDVEDFCARLERFHQIPCFVVPGMVLSLRQFINEEWTNMKNEKSSECVNLIRQKPELIQTIADVIAEKYKKTWIDDGKPIINPLNDFPQAYHYLIHSSAMPVLLALEKKYHNDLAKVIVNKEQCLVKMQERHQLEMARACEHVGFAFSNEDVTKLASKHLADSERLLSHWSSEYTNKTAEQRAQFHKLLIDLHDEMRRNNDALVDSAPRYNQIKMVIDEKAVVTSYSDDDTSLSPVSSPPSTITSSSTNISLRSKGVHMEESFTINLGAQLKTMHNIRLIATDILSFCRFDNDSEMEAQRFQTAMSLYSNSLSAVILLADNRLGCETAVQKEFSTICLSSTEFHFKSFSEQISDIGAHAKLRRDSHQTEDAQQPEGFVHLEEGDFYITKHSNLSQVHLVFHLVADESTLQTKASLSNVTSRHPVITSLRQILKIASSYDIGTITIPLLLTHELTEEITFQWCAKRAELVMKCVKGFMMEMATLDGGVSRTIQFVIPPGVSEEVFDRLRSTLPEVFRTTTTRDLTRTR